MYHINPEAKALSDQSLDALNKGEFKTAQYLFEQAVKTQIAKPVKTQIAKPFNPSNLWQFKKDGFWYPYDICTSSAESVEEYLSSGYFLAHSAKEIYKNGQRQPMYKTHHFLVKKQTKRESE